MLRRRNEENSLKNQAILDFLLPAVISQYWYEIKPFL